MSKVLGISFEYKGAEGISRARLALDCGHAMDLESGELTRMIDQIEGAAVECGRCFIEIAKRDPLKMRYGLSWFERRPSSIQTDEQILILKALEAGEITVSDFVQWNLSEMEKCPWRATVPLPAGDSSRPPLTEHETDK